MAEFAGLALAVLPILISAAEHYHKGLDDLHTLGSRTGDDLILEFYEEIFYEIWQLRRCLKKFVKDLPRLPLAHRKRLLKSLEPDSWKDDAVSASLFARLGETNYSLFEATLRRILHSLDALITTNQPGLSSSETFKETGFCTKLRELRKEVSEGKKLSTFRNRLQFTSNQNKRTKHLEKLTKYNERLQKLLDSTSEVDLSVSRRRGIPPRPKFRALAHNIHAALSRTWPCKCTSLHEELHEAKLCLTQDPKFKDSFEYSFDILFTAQTRESVSCTELHTWHESIVHTISNTDRNQSENNSNKQVESICGLIQLAGGSEVCLQMLLENHQLWEIRPQMKRLNRVKDITLASILRDTASLRVREKRILAVTIAKIVLQLSEGPWLSGRWTPDHISFFETTQCALDLERPYLSHKFTAEVTETGQTSSSNQSVHPIPSLLSLGKLLLEIDRGKPVEIGPLDLTEGRFPNANTELTSTMRYFKEAADDFYLDYTRAIKACLEPTFLAPHQSTSFEEEEVRELLYEHVVMPLEAELLKGFGITLTNF